MSKKSSGKIVSLTSRRNYLRTAGVSALAGLAGCLGEDSAGDGSGGGSSGRKTDTDKLEDSLKILDFGYRYNNEVLEKFENEYEVKVSLKGGGGSAENLALLRSGRSDHDIVTLGNYAVAPAMREGLLQPVDLSKVPQYQNIFDFVKKDYFEQDGNVYGVPASFGQTPLAYDTEEVSSKPKSLKILFDEQYAGEIGGRDDARLQFLYARAAHGLEPLNPKSVDDFDKENMQNHLLKHLKASNALWSSGGEAGKLLKNGSVNITPAWNYVIKSLQGDDFPADRSYPEEGTKAWFLQNCIRKDAKHPNIAHKFINEWQRSIGWTSLMNEFGIAIPNDQVFNEHDVKLSDYGLDKPDRFIYEGPKPPEVIEAMSKVWVNAKNSV